jgi:hypothetical protein
MKVSFKKASGAIKLIPENSFERDWLEQYTKNLKINGRLLEAVLVSNKRVRLEPKIIKKLEYGVDFRISKQSCLLCSRPNICEAFKNGERHYDCLTFKPKN